MWTLLGLIFLPNLICLLFCPQLRSSTRENIQKIWSKDYRRGLWTLILLGFFSYLSLPFELGHQCVKNRFQYNKKAESIAIEMWNVGWTLINLLLLFFVLSIESLRWFAFIPFLRLMDLFCVIIRLLVKHKRPKLAPRALVVLLFSYLNIVTTFACGYLFLQHQNGSTTFWVNGKPTCLTPGQAFYFSLATAATIGYGDITLNTALSSEGLWLIFFENFFILFITVIEFPRLISAYSIELQEEKEKKGADME